MQKVFFSFMVLSAVIITSCQDGAAKSGADVVNNDTVHTGLEGTRDQAGQSQLSTDAKPDTSSGQSTTGVSTGKDSGKDSGSMSTGSNADEQFLKDQVAGNYDEIGLAKLAAKKSSDKEIKQIADYLVSDHSKALDKLTKMAGAKKVKVASSASDEAKNLISTLENKKATDFDKAWCETLIDKHKTTINKYESAATSVSDSQLKSFVNETLPKLRMHLDKLMAYHGKIKA